ncbi:MAG: FAD-binding protein [Ruminococcaceae bacterium]|nr:FAD-binding protein [Oscillospiraceae bacterium]
MPLLDNIKLSPHRDNPAALKKAVVRKLNIPEVELGEIRVSRRSVDARHKDALSLVYSVEYAMKGSRLPEYVRPKPQPVANVPELRPVVVGSGPAGMFCALTLAEAGLRPIVLERGRPVEERTRIVESYFAGGELDCRCNVQFGEGGAGTFSDGKLTTGIKDSRIGTVNAALVEFGAPPEIAYSAKPHIGTDRLRDVVANIRRYIESLGGEYRFSSRLTDVVIRDGRLTAVQVASDDQGEYSLDCGCMVLATGHSARDTFEMLHRRGFVMEAKPFSVGARIEHPQPLIDRAQYGSFAGHAALGAADYKLSARTRDGRGVYTFCMCPGGHVVAAASEPESIVTNGMSYYARDAANANSAVLVGVSPADYGSEHPLAGVEFQRRIEHAAWLYTRSSRAPAQLLGDLLAGRASTSCGKVTPSYRPGVVWGEIGCCLPDFVANGIADGCREFDRRLKGFCNPDAVLTAPESRSSSPVRIVRGENLQSSVTGVYPCGEGAGYAGGIMSAAVDGMRCAEMIIAQYR